MRVYIAGPYTSKHCNSPLTSGGVPTCWACRTEVLRNVNRAIGAANIVLDAGHQVFCPHLFHYLHIRSPRSWEEWIKIDLLELKYCTCLVRLPGESKGADLEVEAAVRDGMMVEFMPEVGWRDALEARARRWAGT